MTKEEREAQREAVKVLAIAVGVREAARQTSINENTILSWSKRGHWFKDTITPKPPQQALAITAIKPSDALATMLQDDSKASRIGFSKAGRKVAEKLGNMDEDELILPETAQTAKQWYGVTAGVHNWEAVEQGSGVMGGLRVYSQQTVLNVQTQGYSEPQAP